MTSTPAVATASSRRWLTLVVVGLAQLMVVFDGTVVNIALPSAQADLGFSDGDRQWVITAYALAFASLGTALLNTIAATAATADIANHLPPSDLVVAQAAVSSYAAAYWWGAGFFAVGGVLAVLLFRRRGDGVSLTSGHAAADAVAAEPVIAH